MTKIKKLTLKTSRIKTLVNSQLIGIVAVGVLILSIAQIAIPIQQVFAPTCPPSTNCHTWTVLQNSDGTQKQVRANKVKMYTYSFTGTSTSFVLDHMWVDVGPVPQMNWLEVGYRKWLGSPQSGDYAIYQDGVSVSGKSGNLCCVNTGNWYWYEIEDIDNNGIWKIYYGQSTPNIWVNEHNFARYSGTIRAGLETNDEGSLTTGQADIDQLQWYWFSYALWNNGGTVADPPYYIVECTEYHVKIKKNTPPTC